MDTLRDLFARERRSDRPALAAPGDPDRRYDYGRLLTNAWKTGNFLHHCGVRGGSEVGVVGLAPEALLGFFGAALLGGVTRFDPPTAPDCRALVAPVGDLDDYDLPPGSTHVGYGGEPDDPGHAFFERDVWSQNPAVPPATVDPDDAVLVSEADAFTHTDVMDAAASVASEVAAGEEVALRAPLSNPGSVVAGVVAPLVHEATILLPDEAAVGNVAVSTGDAPEPRRLDPTGVLGSSA